MSICIYSLNNNCLCTVKQHLHITPEEAHVYIGQTFKFSCLSSHNVTWYFNRGPLPQNAYPVSVRNSTNKILELVNVRYDNAGFYTCRGGDFKFDNYSYYEGDASLVVMGKCKCNIAQYLYNLKNSVLAYSSIIIGCGKYNKSLYDEVVVLSMQ